NRQEVYRTNVIATQHLLQLADEFRVGNIVVPSSDKAANPFNFYGETKADVERMIREFRPRNPVRIIAVRYPDILGSRGSVVSIWDQQLREGRGTLLLSDT